MKSALSRLLPFLILIAPLTGVTADQRVRTVGEKRVQETGPSAMTRDDIQTLHRLLSLSSSLPDRGDRMKRISESLLDYPYITKPLTGSPEEPERMVARLDGFDCVTFVETVLSLSRSRSKTDYISGLRDLRYLNREVTYQNRLHYITDWHKVNVARGELIDLTEGLLTVECMKTLKVVEGFPPRSVSFRYFPKFRLAAVKGIIRDGDLIYFITPRAGLDAYHCGILFRQGENVVMRHASRRQGKVVEQDLVQFFADMPMLGFMLARPADSR